ncbi:carboxylate--amine ligase [Alkalicella caledoniensis]|uniref:Carboxylate--amine ligase n=1 Tax=Alkalicella caledoniensis TaxID=2731377 RepID=A0A7G9WC30_ALKCA|nr:carboxylate--amine ligase [Alkalicella caledoniensis]QNO16242.1 carboxylate--amine ligase [Alkalicella caledoniensis]
MVKKAVIFRVNYYIGLGAARCLGRNNIWVVAAIENNSKVKYGLHTKYIDERIDIINVKENPQKAFEQLVQYAKRQDAKPLLIPTTDPYVEFVDRFLDELREYYLLPPIKKGLYTKLMDKDLLSVLANQNNVQIPKVIEPNSQDNITETLDKVEREIGFPCLIKPVNSHKFVAVFKEKMFIANNRDDIINGLSKANEKKMEVFIQQLIKGFDDQMYTFDCYIDKNGEMTHWATFQKQRQFPINFGASTYIKQRYVPELVEIGSRFLLDIDYRGFAEIEFKKNARDGRFYLIEVNVRTTNFHILLEKLGINTPLIMFKDLNNEKIGTEFIREDTEIHFWSCYEDISAIRGYLRKKQLTLPNVIKSLLYKKVEAIWAFDDPLPGIYFVLEKIKKFIYKRFSR